MAVEIIPFKAEHIKSLNLQSHSGSEEEKLLTAEQFKAVEKIGGSFTFLIDGKIYACAGTVEYTPWRCAVWAIIDNHAHERFLPLVRAMRRMLDEVPYKRIESTVVLDFEKGHRLNQALGFKLEAREMKNYGECGTSHSLYSRVKNGVK